MLVLELLETIFEKEQLPEIVTNTIRKIANIIVAHLQYIPDVNTPIDVINLLENNINCLSITDKTLYYNKKDELINILNKYA